MTTPRFGLGIPTATEGMMYPVPFADIEQAVSLGVAAERLGFESVWGNDHVSTQRYVRAEFDEPPRFYDPITFLAFLSASTTTLRLATAVLVLTFRHPVIVAKQIATLDHLSGGRLVLGVGVGAYREEFDAMFGGSEIHRGRYVDEFLESLAVLFSERRASYSGEFIRFEDIESYPKPAQSQLPVLSGGNSTASRIRAGSTANGWLPACLTPQEYADGMEEIRRVREASGVRIGRPFEAAIQLVVSLHDRHELAVERFRSSHVHSHLSSLGGSTMKGRLGGGLENRNLVGSADDISEQIQEYLDAGVQTFAGLLFATDTVEETLEAMQQFSAQIIGPLAKGVDA
jgi:probable F420-dependent oxidoreductase